MLAKEMIAQCLNCKNVEACWVPDREFATPPINSRDVKLTTKNIDLETFEIDTLHRFNLATTSMYIGVMLPGIDQETLLDIVSTSIFIIEALTNSSNAVWECPPGCAYEVR